MKSLISLFIVSFLVFLSCKKEKNTTDNAAAGTGSTTTGTTTGGGNNANGTTTYDGLFEIGQDYTKNGSTILMSSAKVSTAYLCSYPVVNESSLNYLDMGTVDLNGVIFKNYLYIIYNYYTDSAFTNFSPPYVWHIGGSFYINAFTDTCMTPFPVYTGGLSLPDSISKSAGITIPVTGLSDCDFIKISIIGASGSQHLPSKLVAGNVSQVMYTPAELSGLNPGAAYFSISFYNDNVKVKNGKNLNFRTACFYTVYNFKIVN